MATDKEVTFPVENFVGVDRQVDREDRTPRHFQNLENLWEKEIGILETRQGSDGFLQKPLPAGVTAIDNIHKLYKPNGETVRMVAVHCTQKVIIDVIGSFPMISFAAVNDSSTTDEATWGTTFTTGSGDVIGESLAILMRLVGYGTDIWVNTGVVLAAPATQRLLRVTISSAITAVHPSVTGVEFYSVHQLGKKEVLWFGSIDLITNPTGVFDFRQGPFANFSVPTGIGLQTTQRTFTAEIIPGAGTFKKGQTIFVQVMAQRMLIGTGGFTSKTLSVWRQTDVEPDEIISVTITEDNAGIKISNITPVTFSAIVAAGESIQTMIPVKTMGFHPISGGRELQATITNIPQNLPALVDIKHTDSIKTQFSFRGSDFSTKDMLAKIDDAGVMTPLFVARLSRFWNDGDSGATVRSASVKLVLPWHQEFMRIWQGGAVLLYTGLVDGFTWTTRGTTPLNIAGDNSRWKFVSYSNLTESLVFIVNDFDINITGAEGIKEIPFPPTRESAYQFALPRSGSNYFVTDGNIAGIAIPDFQDISGISDWNIVTVYFIGDKVKLKGDFFEAIEGSTGEEPPSLRFWRDIKVRLPSARFVTEFENSIVVGGGIKTTDITDNSAKDAGSVVYFTRVDNPFDFTDAAASVPSLNFIVIPTQEEILGLGLYTNTSGTEGPIQQMIVGKKNSLWVQSSLSVATATLINLSKKAGLVSHLSIINTPIGTIVAAADNIYLLRGTGEPVPIGNEISRILERSDLTNAAASYHDQHYKLSFHDPTVGGDILFNNVEWWLDIRKMKAQRGLSSWKGPMTGRVIDYVFVEDFAPDGISYESARDRLAVDLANNDIYKADVLTDKDADQVFDRGVPITILLETKDFEISPKDNNFNKLITRQYWKAKTNHPDLIADEQTFIDGILIEEKKIKILKGSTTDFEEQPLRVTPIFPDGRPRGRTIRKILTTDKRIGIGGFSLLYKVERRRI